MERKVRWGNGILEEKVRASQRRVWRKVKV